MAAPKYTAISSPQIEIIEDEDQTVVSSGSHAPSHTVAVTVESSSESSAPAIIPIGTDGVFSNMAAKPELLNKKEEDLPTYEQAARESAPAYMESTVVTSMDENGEVLVEGIPVGSFFIFFATCIVSMTFQLVGFFLTYFLSATHAGKCGARAGLGITLFQFAMFFRGEIVRHPFSSGKSSHEFQNMFLSYVMLILAWFTIIKACGEYIQARKLKEIMESTTDIIV